MPMFTKVLIANRGEIACRVIRTLQSMGIASVAVYAEPDRHARHVMLADEAVCIGPAAAAESYLNAAKILAAARATGAQAIHPGYGFLSENAAFADACEAAGIRFIGPCAEHMRAFGLKHTAREVAQANGVALLPGTGLLPDLAAARVAAARIGYPVMLKSTAGGGGIGMSLCRDAAQLDAAYASVVRLGAANFADAGVYLEKFVERARHIEVQVFGDGRGEAIALGERDCSVQRRNQKVVEETPAPGLRDDERAGLHATAVRLAKAVAYASAGTIEFVFDTDTRAFYFLEVNTRLQVEHCVTEAVTGLDLVRWMIEQAAGELAPLASLAVEPRGASLQVVRVYAEDANKQFQPSAGRADRRALRPRRARRYLGRGGHRRARVLRSAAREDHRQGRGPRGRAGRDARRARADAPLRIETNLDYLRAIVASDVFAAGHQTTAFLSTLKFAPNTVDVIDGGVQTTVQDFPGRLGYWDVGVPPSGPMDDLSFRLANRLVGNEADAAALEFTMVGATLRFNVRASVVLGGAPFAATLDGVPVPFWQTVRIEAGGVLKVGGLAGEGRARMSRGARRHPGAGLPRQQVDVHARPVRRPCGPRSAQGRRAPSRGVSRRGRGGPRARSALPSLAHERLADRGARRAARRTRLLHARRHRDAVRHAVDGPLQLEPHGHPADRPETAMGAARRRRGGPASVEHSRQRLAIGAIDFTGDMPVILGPDGPSLGGFVCPVTIVRAERWKMGSSSLATRCASGA